MFDFGLKSFFFFSNNSNPSNLHALDGNERMEMQSLERIKI